MIVVDASVGVTALADDGADGDLDERRVAFAFDDLAALRLERVPHGPLLARCWELRHNPTSTTPPTSHSPN